MTVAEYLTELAAMRAALDILRSDREQARKAAIPPEVAAELAAIELEYAPQEEAAAGKIAAAEETIKSLVIEAGSTVKAAGLTAVYTAGRVSYDARALDGLLVAMPELAAFRKESAPSVSIRTAK